MSKGILFTVSAIVLIIGLAAVAGRGRLAVFTYQTTGLAVFTDQATVTGNTFTTDDCFVGDTGFLGPTAEAADTGGDGDGFEVTATNAFADGGTDPNYKAENVDGEGDRHHYYNYAISIKTACAILGIEVRLDWWQDAIGGTNSMSVELSWDGGTSWTAAKTDSVETTTEHTGTLGGPADTWGRTWTVSELNDTNFRVRVTSNSSEVSRDFFLDWVPVKIRKGIGVTSTGFLSASAETFDTGGDGDGFELNPTNAFADGSGFASNINGAGDRHRFYDYGISIGAGSSIQGIEVRLDWWLNGLGGANSMSVELSWDGGTSWTAAKTDSVESLTEHTAILGSAADTWGRTWTVSELSNTNFRVRVTSNTSEVDREFFLDWVPVQIAYTPP